MIYDISSKTLIDPKPLEIGFHEIGGFIIIDDGFSYLSFFGSEKYDTIYNRIRCLISLKILTLHGAIIHIKSLLVQSIFRKMLVIIS